MTTANKQFKDTIRSHVFSLTKRKDGVSKAMAFQSVKAKFSADISGYSALLVEKGIMKVISEILRESTEVQDGVSQLRLPGMQCPASFSCVVGGISRWVDFETASLENMKSHEEILKDNINNAVAKHKDWEDKIKHLMPAFHFNPSFTVSEAVVYLEQLDNNEATG